MTDTVAAPGRTRAVPADIMVITGAAAIVAGGLIAAVTGPLDLTHGSWLAAYLVLVAGVGQYVMGRARTWHPSVPGQLDWSQVAAWNLGNAAVVGGTLTGVPSIVDGGSVLLVAALVIAAYRARPGAATPGPASIQWGYRIMLAVLAVSIPVGILLSHLRHG